ncbi:MAG: DUF4412 domain-containing protein [Verrucomicrobiales bacterium]|jgi:hypothetical protein|nr:DUF4412 domain-containing protein [Verrucomicrobiales bacterium]
MKITLLPVLLLGLVVSGSNVARADLTMVQDTQYGQQAQRVTVKIKGDKMRIDGMPMNYMIMDVNSGNTFVIMPAQRVYVKMAGSTLAAAMQKVGGENRAGDAQFVATGQTEKIGDYDTEIFTVETPRLKGKYWVARNYPDYEQIKEEVCKLSSGFMMNAAKGRIPDIGQLPGIPVKTEIEVQHPMPMTVQSILISANQDPISDDTFVIPGDFHQLQVPESTLTK